MNLLRMIKDHMKRSPILYTVTPLKRIKDKEVRNVLKKLYSSPIRCFAIYATLVNACYTESKKYFLFSHKLLSNLVEQDKNSSVGIITRKDYCKFLGFCLGEKILKRLVPIKKIPKLNASAMELCCRDLKDTYFFGDRTAAEIKAQRLLAIRIAKKKFSSKKTEVTTPEINSESNTTTNKIEQNLIDLFRASSPH